MGQYDDFLRESEALKDEEDMILVDMNKIIEENRRIEDFASNARENIKEIESLFKEQTGLNGLDITFLFLATAIQCVRQYVLTNDKFRFKNDQAASKAIKKFVPISLTGPVPYDAFKKEGFDGNTGLSGRNHRYTTLGHDPMLGWIFGTTNILSETVTKNNILLMTYNTKLVGNEYKITRPSNVVSAFSTAIDRVRANYKDLPLAVMQHAVHMASDAFTKMGLPIPIINSISPDLTSKLLANGIDTYSVARGFAISGFINMVVASIHGLFYKPNSDLSRDMYEVKTRKILSYSNIIASSSNMIYAAVSADLKKLDVGGILQTIYRLIIDTKFIADVKAEFVYNEFASRVKGTEFDFNIK